MQAGQNLPSSSRALVPLKLVASNPHPHRITPRASAFLAHLIATAKELPQTRERRRADVAEVISVYQAAIAKIRQLNAQ
jgi:hypothetical protein